MDTFLHKVFLDNTVLDYLITAGIILLVLVLKTILSKYVAGLISRMVINNKQQDNRVLFRGLVVPPIRLFVMVLTVIIAISRLNYPTVLSVPIYRTNLHDILESVARAVLIISFIWLCNRMVAYVAALLHAKAQETNDRTDDQLIVFFRDFLKVLIWIIGVLLILKFSFGFAMSNVFTGLSIVGAALALAFRESLENLIASFIIFFDKPFTIGDLVKVQAITGTVESIGLRSTRIRTTEKTYVTVPNKQMVDTMLDNQSLRTQRNVLTVLEVELTSNVAQISAVISAIENLLQQEEILDRNVYLSDTGKQANIIQVEYFVTMDLPVKDFFKLRETINLSILNILKENQVQLAATAREIGFDKWRSNPST
jgi:MscS family membrane protein